MKIYNTSQNHKVKGFQTMFFPLNIQKRDEGFLGAGVSVSGSLWRKSFLFILAGNFSQCSRNFDNVNANLKWSVHHNMHFSKKKTLNTHFWLKSQLHASERKEEYFIFYSLKWSNFNVSVTYLFLLVEPKDFHIDISWFWFASLDGLCLYLIKIFI